MSTNQDDRQLAIANMLDDAVGTYTAVWQDLDRADRDKLPSPMEVRAAILQGVAKTGKLRFKKAKPPMRLDGELNEAFLFWLFREHTGMGAYRSIDGLMMARWEFGNELYEKWDKCVDLMAALSRS